MAKKTSAPIPPPEQAPLDLVRNPNFDAAMAQQNYFNNLSRLVAERDARGPEYNLMPIGARGSALPAPLSDFDLEQLKKQYPQYQINKDSDVPPAMRYTYLANKQTVSEELPPAAIQYPIGQQSDLPPAAIQYPITQQSDLPPAAIQYPITQQSDLPPAARMYGNAQYAPPPIPSIPINQQMQNYNNFLQQGMQNSNTLNQGAMANFANMQPGMQAPQQAGATTLNPAMPVAGMGMQQPIQAKAKRNISTFDTPSTRFA